MSIIHTDYYTHRKEWVAVFDGYDGAMIDNETPSDDPVGYGDTELEAITDLLCKEDD